MPANKYDYYNIRLVGGPSDGEFMTVRRGWTRFYKPVPLSPIVSYDPSTPVPISEQIAKHHYEIDELNKVGKYVGYD